MDLLEKIHRIISSGWIRKADKRNCQVEFVDNGQLDSYGFMPLPYGYFARPKGGETATMIRSGAVASVVVGVDGPEIFRDESLEPGDVAVANDAGASMRLVGKDMRLTGRKFSFQGDHVELISLLCDLIDSLQNLRVVTPQGESLIFSGQTPSSLVFAQIQEKLKTLKS